jgi:hypothetical protein
MEEKSSTKKFMEDDEKPSYDHSIIDSQNKTDGPSSSHNNTVSFHSLDYCLLIIFIFDC